MEPPEAAETADPTQAVQPTQAAQPEQPVEQAQPAEQGEQAEPPNAWGGMLRLLGMQLLVFFALRAAWAPSTNAGAKNSTGSAAASGHTVRHNEKISGMRN